MPNNQTHAFISMHMQNMVKFNQFVPKILSLTCNNPNLDLVSTNAYAIFGFIPSMPSQDIEQKPNSDDNQGP